MSERTELAAKMKSFADRADRFADELDSMSVIAGENELRDAADNIDLARLSFTEAAEFLRKGNRFNA
jgi:hypothetical protein